MALGGCGQGSEPVDGGVLLRRGDSDGRAAVRAHGLPPPEPPDFLDGIIAFFRWETSRWPIDFAGTLLAGLGFVAFGAVGVMLSRLAEPADARRTVVPALMVIGATLGAVSQLLWIGVKPVATSPQLCECGLRAEEIMSRLMTLNVASGCRRG